MVDGSCCFKACDVVGHHGKCPQRRKLRISWQPGDKEAGRLGTDVEISRMHHP